MTDNQMKQNLQPRKEKNAVKALEHQALYPSCNWSASLYLVPPLPSRTDHGDMGTMGAAPTLCDKNSPFLSSLLVVILPYRNPSYPP